MIDPRKEVPKEEYQDLQHAGFDMSGVKIRREVQRERPVTLNDAPVLNSKQAAD